MKVLVCGGPSMTGSRFRTACGTVSHRQLGPVVIVNRLHTFDMHRDSGQLLALRIGRLKVLSRGR